MERRQVTLKEKLKAHYDNRNFQPQETSANKVGVAFYWFMTISLLFESLLILIPTLFKDNTTVKLLCQVLVFMALVECNACWFLTYKDVSNYVRKTFIEKYFTQIQETPPGWRSCPSCQLDAPPRSHHCKLCEKCILKRDHHCFFTGSCIGFYNQRYFIIFCVHMIWSNAFALYLQLTYLNEAMPIFSNYFVNYLPGINVLLYFFGNIPIGIVLIVIHSHFCIFCLGAGIFFFVWQMMIVSSGQTSHEAWKNINPYGKSVLDNFRSVFGPLKFSWLMLFFPVPFDLSEDGIKWEIQPKSVKGH
ncbi:palmitoyltransferase ZDHHC22 [Patella vulgata]|uniref:palmitoyltransferase ZDHHC22 n=1 Tax=Patella vulgata TaxID=6465 RepID=UPI0024A99805|nr:palmitoyltransferase ZDHHC22 [Patella vulgata]